MRCALCPKVLDEARSLPSPDSRSRGLVYLLDELLLVQQVQPRDVVLLFQDQRKVLRASDRQLLLHCEDDVLPGTERQAGHLRGRLALVLPDLLSAPWGGCREKPVPIGSTASSGSRMLTGHPWDLSRPLVALRPLLRAPVLPAQLSFLALLGRLELPSGGSCVPASSPESSSLWSPSLQLLNG